MSAQPVRRLHTDIDRLNAAKKARSTAAQTERKDEKALKVEKRHVTHGRDVFVGQGKELKRDRTSLTNLRAGENKALAPLDKQIADLQQQYDASVDPATGMGDPLLQMELGGAQQQRQSVQDGWDARVGAKQTEVQGDVTARAATRARIETAKKNIGTDQRDVKHDTSVLARTQNRVKHDRKVAMKDLTPAEYKLGLHATNQVRHELGLKAVHNVIRPGVPNVVGGQVGSWIAQAQTILKQHGVPLSKMNAHDIATIIQFESSGNPRAINNWDSNAAAGHPSEGLMQTIGPTFNSYKLPGHGSILNPVDNIIAGVRYAISRYGSISNVPGIRAVHAGGSYVGY